MPRGKRKYVLLWNNESKQNSVEPLSRIPRKYQKLSQIFLIDNVSYKLLEINEDRDALEKKKDDLNATNTVSEMISTPQDDNKEQKSTKQIICEKQKKRSDEIGSAPCLFKKQKIENSSKLSEPSASLKSTCINSNNSPQSVNASILSTKTINDDDTYKIADLSNSEKIKIISNVPFPAVGASNYRVVLARGPNQIEANQQNINTNVQKDMDCESSDYQPQMIIDAHSHIQSEVDNCQLTEDTLDQMDGGFSDNQHQMPQDFSGHTDNEANDYQSQMIRTASCQIYSSVGTNQHQMPQDVSGHTDNEANDYQNQMIGNASGQVNSSVADNQHQMPQDVSGRTDNHNQHHVPENVLRNLNIDTHDSKNNDPSTSGLRSTVVNYDNDENYDLGRRIIHGIPINELTKEHVEIQRQLYLSMKFLHEQQEKSKQHVDSRASFKLPDTISNKTAGSDLTSPNCGFYLPKLAISRINEEFRRSKDWRTIVKSTLIEVYGNQTQHYSAKANSNHPGIDERLYKRLLDWVNDVLPDDKVILDNEFADCINRYTSSLRSYQKKRSSKK